jgi:hypothetical protein
LKGVTAIPAIPTPTAVTTLTVSQNDLQMEIDVSRFLNATTDNSMCPTYGSIGINGRGPIKQYPTRAMNAPERTKRWRPLRDVRSVIQLNHKEARA